MERSDGVIKISKGQLSMNDKEYIQILTESLQKKYRILQEIEQMNKEQNDIMMQEDIDMAAWEHLVDEKAACIDELDVLDEGFETLYKQVKEELSKHQQDYADEIREMKECISRIVAKNMDIQVQEARNKELAQRAFCTLKKQNRVRKQSNRVANIYDTSMKKLNVIDAQFLDRKK